MKYKIKKLSRANIEVVEAYAYYETKASGLGERFLEEVEKELKYISKYPRHYQKKHNFFRQAVLKKFPFVIIYRVDNVEILVYSVFNTFQNPIKNHNL